MLRLLNSFISSTLEFFRWPIGLVITIFLPALAMIFIRALFILLGNAPQHLPFFAAFLCYFFFWFWQIRHWKVSWFSTLEHECTHAITAWACGCKVVGLRATWKKGGACTYQGKTNWLIRLTPYFLPTLCLPIIVVHQFSPLESSLLEGLLGATLAYHLTSTLRETHKGQTDLSKSGWIFVLSFLPGANLLVYTWLLQQVHPTQGWLNPIAGQLKFILNQIQRIIS
jgi:hypothetical protein